MHERENKERQDGSKRERDKGREEGKIEEKNISLTVRELIKQMS